jgi:hypothetical protein
LSNYQFSIENDLFLRHHKKINSDVAIQTPSDLGGLGCGCYTYKRITANGEKTTTVNKMNNRNNKPSAHLHTFA